MIGFVIQLLTFSCFSKLEPSLDVFFQLINVLNKTTFGKRLLKSVEITNRNYESHWRYSNETTNAEERRLRSIAKCGVGDGSRGKEDTPNLKQKPKKKGKRNENVMLRRLPSARTWGPAANSAAGRSMQPPKQKTHTHTHTQSTPHPAHPLVGPSHQWNK